MWVVEGVGGADVVTNELAKPGVGDGGRRAGICTHELSSNLQIKAMNRFMKGGEGRAEER